MKAMYIVIGTCAMLCGIAVWTGWAELSQFSAACFAFGFGCMCVAEGINGGK